MAKISTLSKSEPLAFYVVMNEEGKFFRKKGYNGTGNTWVDSMETASIYAKLSYARSVVTFFTHNYPSYSAPKIVKLTVSRVETLIDGKRGKAKKGEPVLDVEVTTSDCKHIATLGDLLD